MDSQLVEELVVANTSAVTVAVEPGAELCPSTVTVISPWLSVRPAVAESVAPAAVKRARTFGTGLSSESSTVSRKVAVAAPSCAPAPRITFSAVASLGETMNSVLNVSVAAALARVVACALRPTIAAIVTASSNAAGAPRRMGARLTRPSGREHSHHQRVPVKARRLSG